MYGSDPSLLAAFAPAWLWSAGLGVGIGVLYCVASLLTNRYAMRRDQRRFVLLVLGGMIVRMLVALALVALVLLLLPVRQAAFIGSFFGVFVIGLVVEVTRLHRRLTAVKTP